METWINTWAAILGLVLAFVIVWGLEGWLHDRHLRQAWVESQERTNADTCQQCGRSRVFYRDGERMIAPPHFNRCQPVADYDGEPYVD